MLTAEGYQVQQANDAETALQLVQSSLPDLILTDVQLPGMDGLEFTRRIKAGEATKHIKIIALTAYSMIEDEEQARLAGCDD
jgi:two-component system cell cycle response regulator DivK